MCIRDSLSPCPAGLNPPWNSATRISLTAVSYTHLDVYKRQQLSEEGATQFFRPLMSNDLILGAVGVLQFDVAAYRLKDEYGVEASFEPVGVVTARWVRCNDCLLYTSRCV